MTKAYIGNTKIVFPAKAGEVPKVIEIRIFKAGSEPYSPFKNTCGICKGDVGKTDYCKNGCKNFNAKTDIIKGIQIGSGEKEVFAKDEIDAMKEVKKNLTVRTTIKASEITRTRSMDSYYVVPSDVKVGKKHIIDSDQLDYYSILYAGLVASGEAIVVTEANRGKEHMGVLHHEEGRIIYTRMYFDEYYRPLEKELVDQDFKLTQLSKKQTEGAVKLIKGIKKIPLAEIEYGFTSKVEALIEAGKSLKVSYDTPKITVKNPKPSKKKIDSFLS